MDKEIKDLRRSGELSKQTRCLTPLLGDLEPETKDAIREIAEATRQPVDLKRPECPATFHNPRNRTVSEAPKSSRLMARLLRWTGLKGGRQ